MEMKSLHFDEIDGVLEPVSMFAKLDASKNLVVFFDVAVGMDADHGVIWVYGVGDEGVMALTDLA